MQGIIIQKDWRSYLNPVRNQGDANCCFAFTLCGCLEAYYHIVEHIQTEDRRILLSPQDIYGNVIKNDEEESDGYSIGNALLWVIENGVVLEDDCPYLGRYKLCEDIRKVKLRLVSYKVLETVREIQQAVEIAPVMAEIYWSEDLAYFEGDGIFYTPQDITSFDPNEKHGVLIIGFGEERIEGNVTRFWLVQNSHGVTWGNNGFGKIDQATYEGKSLIDMAWAVTGIDDRDREGNLYG